MKDSQLITSQARRQVGLRLLRWTSISLAILLLTYYFLPQIGKHWVHGWPIVIVFLWLVISAYGVFYSLVQLVLAAWVARAERELERARREEAAGSEAYEA